MGRNWLTRTGQGRTPNGEALADRSGNEALVIGNESADLISDAERRCQMKSIETSKPCGINRRRLDEHLIIEGHQGDIGQERPSVRCVLLAVAGTRSDRLHPEQGAGDIPTPAGQLQQESLKLGLPKSQLHVRRAIQIGEPPGYSRSSRISSSTSRLGGPDAGGALELRTLDSRSPLGIVAPRSAARRASGESAGPEGSSRATSLPRSVTVKLSPALTWTR